MTQVMKQKPIQKERKAKSGAEVAVKEQTGKKAVKEESGKTKAAGKGAGKGAVKEAVKGAVKEEPTKAKKAANMDQLPTIQNMLEVKLEDRADKANKYYETVKPFLVQYMQKKQGSRVLQLIFKWGCERVKNGIHKCAQANWKDLLKSKFALYLLEKISKEVELPGALEDAVLLQSSWEGARILDQYISRGDENLRKVKDKFYVLWEKSKENEIKSQQTLHNLALKAVQKTYENLPISKLIIRLALSSMFAEEKQKVMTHLGDRVGDWVGDEEGVRLFIELINHSDPKLKKTLVKSFKGHIAGIIELNNPTYVALVKLLTEVDDTVMIEKTLLTEVEELLPLIVSNKHAFSIIFSLFSPRNHNFNILGKYEHIVTHSECKKPEEARKKEVRAHLYSPTLKFLEGEPLSTMLRNHVNNKLVVGIYKSMQEDGEQAMFKSFVSKIANLFLEDTKESLKDKTFEESLCADVNANKVIKGILWLQDEVVDYFCDEFAKLISKNMEQFLASRAGFVLLGLVEKGGRDYLLAEVKKHKGKLTDSPVGKHFLTLFGNKTQ